jgi:hypothetical protein
VAAVPIASQARLKKKPEYGTYWQEYGVNFTMPLSVQY